MLLVDMLVWVEVMRRPAGFDLGLVLEFADGVLARVSILDSRDIREL